jgi:anhydro-N-acetylmuramic acid kinase
MKLTVIGIMSGTSYDAIDAAAAEFDLSGEDVICRPLGLHTAAWPSSLRARLAAVLPPNPTTIDEVCRLDTEIGQLFGSIAAAANQQLTSGTADLVACHGQTVFHWVERQQALGTLQLGAAAWIAHATGLPTLTDLRTRDITAGGQGAPLASTLDTLLLLNQPRVRRGALNLGGIANITVLDGTGEPIAYDIGPANALIDAVIAEATNGRERMDTDGARAARGTVHAGLLNRMLSDPYYALLPPKSTGKELFHIRYLHQHTADLAISLDNLVATLTELTAQLAADACRRHHLDELISSGGGIRNPTLMRRIVRLASPTVLRHSDEFGIPAQAKEAYLLALLGYLSIHGLPGTYASATGAATSSVLGSLTPGAVPLRLPEPATIAPRRMKIA